MNKQITFWHVLALAAAILPTAYLAWAWPLLPAQIPTHFGAGGIDGYTDRGSIWLLTTALPLGVYALLRALPRLDPRQRVAADSLSFAKLQTLVLAALGSAAAYSLWLGLHPSTLPGRGLNAVVAVFFALLGNYLTTVRPNYFMGIRTPWALESDQVWAKTHRFVGRLWFGGGLLLATLAFVLPEGWFETGLLVLGLGGGVAAYIYSYWCYKKDLQSIAS